MRTTASPPSRQVKPIFMIVTIHRQRETVVDPRLATTGGLIDMRALFWLVHDGHDLIAGLGPIIAVIALMGHNPKKYTSRALRAAYGSMHG